MRRLTDFVLHHKLLVVIAWLLLAGAGLATATTTTGRLSTSFALPGQPGYETNARIDRIYHNGGSQEVTIATVTLTAGLTTQSPAALRRVGQIFAAARSRAGEPSAA